MLQTIQLHMTAETRKMFMFIVHTIKHFSLLKLSLNAENFSRYVQFIRKLVPICRSTKNVEYFHQHCNHHQLYRVIICPRFNYENRIIFTALRTRITNCAYDNSGIY